MLHVVCCCCFCCCCCRCWCCCWWGCCCCCCPVIVTIQAWCQPSSHLVTVENKTVLLGRVPIACVDATQKAPTNMGSEFQSEKHQRPFRLLANVIDTFNTYTLLLVPQLVATRFIRMFTHIYRTGSTQFWQPGKTLWVKRGIGTAHEFLRPMEGVSFQRYS